MACYDMDRFREFVTSPSFHEVYVLEDDLKQQIAGDDVALMQFAFRLLRQVLFNEISIDTKAEALDIRLARKKEREAMMDEIAAKVGPIEHVRLIPTTNTTSKIKHTCKRAHSKAKPTSFKREPYYEADWRRNQHLRSGLRNKLPVLLKGPTGCGKTRFMEYMAWRLKRPLITVSCHDDLTASDLVGRYLVKGGETVWVDGPLARAVRAGAICYLDEIVEARKDTMVVIHPLADDRRVLPMEKLGTLLTADDRFLPRHFLQPRLPERAEGPQAKHAAALCRAGIRLPRRRAGSENRRQRIRRDRCAGREAGQVRADDAQPQGQRPGRRRQHAPAGACGQTHRLGRRPGHRLPERHRPGDYRRRGNAGCRAGTFLVAVLNRSLAV